MKLGFRIKITEKSTEHSAHKSGVRPGDSLPVVRCPNCIRVMFPAFDLDFCDSRLKQLNIWNQPRLTIFFCPSCLHYTEPYYERVTMGEVVIIGGHSDGGKVIQDICYPYEWRDIELSAISPIDSIDDYIARRIEDGVYHQIGGEPIKGGKPIMRCCSCSELMMFSGILDYDDLNVPLYENDHSPVSLIIGDMDSMNIYICKKCSIIGLKWVH